MSEFQPADYEPNPPVSSGMTQLLIAAIILMIVACLACLWGAVDGFFRIPIMMGKMPAPVIMGQKPSDANIIAFFVLDMINFLLAPVVLFGGIQMLRRKMYAFTRV